MKNAIITVGYGRGFLVRTNSCGLSPIVITAAHALPDRPPAHGGAFAEEKTYPHILGPIGEPPSVWAECLFLDPVADIAVLSAPDNQVFDAEYNAYSDLVEKRSTFRVGAVTRRASAWLLTLDGRWDQSEVDMGGHTLTLLGAHIEGGMSGSPVMSDGCAVGVVALGQTSSGHEQYAQHLQPALVHSLPGWLLADVLSPRATKALPRVLTAPRRAFRRRMRAALREADALLLPGPR